MTSPNLTDGSDVDRSLGGQREAVCDRAEAAWKQGRPPRIEDEMAGFPEQGRGELFRALLVLELAYRRSLGEHPTVEEYCGRFPGHGAAVESAFADCPTTSLRSPHPRRDDPPTSDGSIDGRPGDRDGETRATAAGTGGPVGSGRFRVLREHARGGLGKIYVARDQELGREVALKEIKDQHADDFKSRARFVLEAEVTGRLEHPGIVPIYGLGAHPDGRPYAMRLIKGETLKEAIALFHKSYPPIPGRGRDRGERLVAMQQLLRRFLDVCNAIEYAHSQRWLHRDIKPSNVMLGPYGETLVVDWGLAKSFGPHDGAGPDGEGAPAPEGPWGSAETLPGEKLGTPGYMSPEQAAGTPGQIGVASDVYCLGATLYHLLTGHAPFEGMDVSILILKLQRGEFPRPRQVNPWVARGLEVVCLKAMALKPEDRYATPRQLADDIERWLADEPVGAWREPWSSRARRWTRRHGHFVLIGSVLLVATSVVASAILYERTTSEMNDRAAKREQELVLREVDLKAALVRKEKEAVSQQYHALLNEVRANRGGPGWTRAGLEKLKQAAALDTTSRDPLELRDEAAACLMALDVRPAGALARDINVGRLAYSPDGKRLAVAMVKRWRMPGSVRLIDTETRQTLKDFGFSGKDLFMLHSDEQASSLAFSPDGRWLAMGTKHGRVFLWEWAQPGPRPVEWVAHHGHDIHVVLAFAGDGRTLWTGSRDKVVKRWDLSAGPPGAPREVASHDLNLSKGGNTFVRDMALGEGILWVSLGWGATDAVASLDPRTLQFDDAFERRGGYLRLGYRLALSPDRGSLAGAARNMIRLLDTQRVEVFRTLLEASIDIGGDPANDQDYQDHDTLQFSPDGTLLASCIGREGYVGLWDVAAGARVLAKIPMRNQSGCNSAFSPDGRHLAVPGEKGVDLYELDGRDIARTAAQSRAWVSDFAWSPDGRSIAWITTNGTQNEVSVAAVFRQGESFRAVLPESSGISDGPRIVSHPRESVMAIHAAGTNNLWDYRRDVSPTRIGAKFVGSMAFAPDGSRLWGVASKGNVDSWPLLPTIRATRWEDPSGKPMGVIGSRGLTELIQAATGDEGLSGLAADAHWVVAAGKDGRTRVLDARDGTLHKFWSDDPFDSGKDPQTSVALSPGGDLAATGMRSGRIRLRRVPGGEEVALLDRHRDAVDALDFHHGGHLLASGSRDGTVRLWRPAGPSWEEVLVLRAAGGPVRRLRFSPDGRLLGVLVQNETAVRIWDLSALHSRLAAMGLGWEGDGTPRPAAVQDPPTGGGQAATRGRSSAGEVVRR